jgi:hypothetical protein
MRRPAAGLSRRGLLSGAILTPWLVRPAAAIADGTDCTAAVSTRLSAPSRALSLRLLQEDLAACAGGTACRGDAATMYGLTRINGYVLDPQNADIVLFGEANTDEPELYSEDFAVALRALLLRYGHTEGNVRYFSYPGISIDPLPETLRRIAAIESASAGLAEELDAQVTAWREACQAPQAVRIIGVPPSRFAATMLAADYRLKRIADGDLHPLPALRDIMQQAMEEAIAAARAHRPIHIHTLDRFWFVAGTCASSNGRSTVVLDRCDVRLLTERELMTRSGETAGTGTQEAHAARFACDVSRLYPELAAQDPVYARLQALYRWMALARLLIDRSAATEVQLDLTVLTDQYQLAPVSIPATVAGHFAVGSADVGDTAGTYILRLPSCGGVEMAFQKGIVQPSRRYAGIADDWGRQAVTARPAGTRQPAWTIT